MAGKIALGPEDLVAKFKKLGCNKSALARDQGVSVPAISKALNRAGYVPPEGGEKKQKPQPKRKPAGKRRLARKNKKTDDTAKAAVVSGVDPAMRERIRLRQNRSDDIRADAMNSIAALQTINQSLLTAQDIQAQLLEEMKRSKNLKPFQVELLMKTINTSAKLIGDAHKIKKDLITMDMVTEWMHAVVDACAEESPDIVQRIFARLIDRGLAEQADISIPAEGAGA